jgi:hypothetical protein
VAALLLTALTVYIVTALVPVMFGEDYLADPDRLHATAWQWNVLNVLRMVLTATTAWYLFSAFRKLDRNPWRGSDHR